MNPPRFVALLLVHPARCFAAFLGILLGVLSSSAHARAIDWYCDPGGSKKLSTGALLDSRMRFELGVFTGSFVPTSSNTDQWAANWQAAKRVAYNPATGVFTGTFTVISNSSPFTLNKRAYLWGFSHDYADGEWILASDATWTWPAPDPLNPNDLQWDIAQATDVVVGTVHASGSPFVLQTAHIAVSPPPLTTWLQWQMEALNDETHNLPGDDPDGDGVTNAEEYAYATNPLQRGSVARPVVQTVTVGTDRYLAIFVPRRPDRSLTTEFGVSNDLQSWDWSSGATVVVSQTIDGWTVRCASPVSNSVPTRYLRARFTVP